MYYLGGAAAVLTTNHVMRRQDVIDFLGELTQTANAKTRDARSRSCASQFGTACTELYFGVKLQNLKLIIAI